MPANQALKIWSLFSGIGGLEMGLENAGLGKTTLQCEIDPYANKILAKHWPDVVRMTDVKTINQITLQHHTRLSSHADYPDIICGGFPCQPHSLAGKRKGANDDRHLWPEFARIIRTFKPSIVVAENVPGIRTNGALNEVLNDLSVLGYFTEWVRLGAAALGAPHLRERIFIVAYPGSPGRQQIAGSASSDESANGRRSQENHVADGDAESDRARIDPGAADQDSDAYSAGRKNVKKSDSGTKSWKEGELWNHTYGLCKDLADTEPFIFTDAQRAKLPVHPKDTSWFCEPNVGRVATGVSSRVHRLRVLGNAVVPQVAEFVGSCIYDAITQEV